MSELTALLSLPPVFRGAVGMLIAGSSFPLCGVLVLRLNLVPLRYMLMHGVLLGGALSCSLSLPLLPLAVGVNVLLVLVLLLLTKDPSYGFGMASSVGMVLSMALASLVMHAAKVPANDALSLLWGSPFALRYGDLIVLAALSILLIVYILVRFRILLALFYHQDVARSMGIAVRFHYGCIIMIVALIVALAMKVLGALLIDGLLILPVLLATRVASRIPRCNGIRGLFVTSSIYGFTISATGYILAVVYDIPPSAAVTLVAGGLYCAAGVILKEKKQCKE